MADTSPPASPASEETAATQTRRSLAGEITGYVCSIGAVYIAERACPAKTQALIASIAKHIGHGRGSSAAAEMALAKRIVDVGIMNIGGSANMLTQFAMRRHGQPKEDREALGYELGRVVTGRVGGTVTAVTALAMAETFAPRLMDFGERQGARLLRDRPWSARFSELALSNAVQSVGALAGNIPAQLLYDRLMGRDPQR